MIKKAKEEQLALVQKVRNSPPKKSKGSRGTIAPPPLHVVSSRQFIPVYKYNYMRDFTMEHDDPSAVVERLEEYRADANTELTIEPDEKHKNIRIGDTKNGLKLKIKFYKTDLNEEDSPIKITFVKKAGDIKDQYVLINEITSYMTDILQGDTDTETDTTNGC